MTLFQNLMLTVFFVLALNSCGGGNGGELLPLVPESNPEILALYEFGAEVYAQKCAQCHDPLDVSKKRGASRQDIFNALDIPQMRNIELNDEELDALAYVLNNQHPEDVEVPIELTSGDLIFDQQCASCHAEGAVTFFPLLDKYTDLDSIAQYTEDTMPFNNAEACVGECATLVAEYILTLEFEAEVTAADLGTQRLKRSHYYKTIEFLFGQYGINIDGLSHPLDPIVEGFEAGSEIDATLVLAYHLNAGTIAKELVEAIEDNDDIIGCTNLEADCVRQFYLDFAERAYRHPLLTDQTEQLDTVFSAAGSNPLLGIGNVVGYVLQSPFFLYYLDTAEEDSDYTLASQLSFTLWNEPPDEELLTLAEQGELSSPAEFNRQIDRLLDDDKGHQTLLDFANQWLSLERVKQVFKDVTAVPGFSADVIVDLEQDLLAFVEASLQEENSFEYLFNGSYQLSNNLASTLSQWNNNVQIDRNGIMSQPGMLAILSGPTERSPIARGAYVMDKLLCDHRPPVDAIDDVTKDIVVPENATPRERTEILTESPVCQVCHASINPLGFGFEDFDGLGLPTGESMVESIQIPATKRAESVALSFDGIEDLQQSMLQTHQFYDCAVDKVMGYANLVDRPSIASANAIYDEFRDSANLRALFKAIALTMLENN